MAGAHCQPTTLNCSASIEVVAALGPMTGRLALEVKELVGVEASSGTSAWHRRARLLTLARLRDGSDRGKQPATFMACTSSSFVERKGGNAAADWVEVARSPNKPSPKGLWVRLAATAGPRPLRFGRWAAKLGSSPWAVQSEDPSPAVQPWRLHALTLVRAPPLRAGHSPSCSDAAGR